MSWLLDTDTSSAYLKEDPRIVSKASLYFGGLNVSAITAGELMTWALRASAPPRRLQVVRDFLATVDILPVELAVAERFGELHAALLDRGSPIGLLDLFIAACALVHDMTVVTHNVRDFGRVPGLHVVDWMVP